MFNMLFDEIGKKIKNLAIAIFFFEAVASILAGLACTLSALINIVTMDLSLPVSVLYLIIILLVSILIILVGILVSWVSVFFIYGFGELIDRSCRVDDQLDQLLCLQGTDAPHSANRNKYAYPASSAVDGEENTDELIPQLEYALDLRDYYTMIQYLQKVDDNRIAAILTGPKDKVRERLEILLENLTQE